MKRIIKRAMAVVLTAVMLLTAAPLSGFVGLDIDFGWLDFSTKVSALDSSGSCGNNVTYTFDSSTGLLTISGTGSMSNDSNFKENEDIETVIINNGVTSIGSWAFYNCFGLKSVTIPDSVTSIGHSAFRGCTSLINVMIPDNVTKIVNYAFCNCTALASVTMSAGITSISNSLFYGCSSLTDIVIPNNVTSIGESSFYGCSNLTNVTMPESLIAIGDSAFYKCINLKNLIIPDSVTTIGASAFYKCTGLTNTTVPITVTDIGTNAFGNCTNICLLVYKDSCAEQYAIDNSLNHRVFLTIPDRTDAVSDKITDDFLWSIDKTTETLTIDCQNEMISFDSKVAPWIFYKDYIKHIVINDGCTKVSEKAFMQCDKAESMLIPDSVTNIDDFAFYNCKSLKQIAIPCSAKIYNSESTFFNCTNIEKAAITKGTGTMQNYGTLASAFSSTTYYQYTPWYISRNNIKKIIIEDGVQSIGTCAFSDCTGLNELSIPCSTKIYNSASVFYNCTNIEKVILTKGTGTMQNYGTSTDSTSSTTYYQYTPWYISQDSIKEIKVGDGVENIGNYAFYNCTNLTGITISDSVTTINSYAFGGCSGLTSIEIPNSVTTICYRAFYNCTGLISVTMSNNVTNIEERAFEECKELISIMLTDKLTSIGNNVFEHNTKIILLVYKDSLAERYAKIYNIDYYIISKIPNDVDSVSGKVTKNFLWSIDKETGILTLDCKGSMLSFEDDVAPWIQYEEYIEHIVINDGCTSISKKAFMLCSKIEYVSTPNSVTSIDSYAFYGCSKLNSIIISDSVTSINDYVFYGCFYLNSITISDCVTYIGSYAFYNCQRLTNITIPNRVTNIGNYVFENCTGLINVTIGSKVKSIGNGSFYNCQQLKRITIPNSVTVIGDSAFRDCANLVSITIPDSVTIIGDSTFRGCANLIYISIPDSVTNIGDSAFNGCIKLTKITISNNITEISPATFFACTSLTNIVIPNSVISIGESAFYGCVGLRELTLPCSAKIYNSEYAFYNCSNIEKVIFTKGTGTMENYSLSTDNSSNATYYQYTPWYNSRAKIKEIVIEEGITNIGDNIFKECVNLDTINIPNSVTCIGHSAFCDSIGLKSITIPDNVKCIHTGAFRGCTGLVSIVIPDSVTCIGDASIYNDTFYNCSGLRELTLPCSAFINYSTGTFKGCTKIKKITITKGTGTMQDYDSGFQYYTPWYISRYYIEEIIIEDGVKNIGNYAFNGCIGLTSITIPDSVTDIGRDAFSGCTNLTSIDMGNGVTEVHNSSFKNLISLKSVTIGTGVTTIGDYAFNGCTGLEEMVIPYSVKSIGTAAFTGCTNLGSLTVYNRNCTFADDATAYYTTIYGFTGSTAETYANEKGFDFVAIDETHTHVYDDANDKTCNLCGAERLVHYTLTPANGAVVDNENGLIYGIASNSADINSYVNTVDDTMTVECDSALLGTGSVVNIVKDDVIVDSYRIVVFGDVNGDGWYDGMDAVTVSCIANGLLTKDQIGEAAYMAADCNHDGVVDEFDVAILNQAGVLLANVDQTKTQEELAADSDYVEYLSLIDQNPTIEEEPEKPEQDNGFIAKLIAFIETILKYIVTLVNKIW